ncbi:archaea-specific SMC-related protein [Halocatena marina]|uniref:archaea-specific SMC-related protein n=1 Tax=Halocatena marina TaxID=2934937 RepID=UPI00200CBA2F|nr:archaea-specific SMC-related protein [Halocatena marina]
MTWHLSIENIAGIRRGEAHIEPGVNAVRASNWQGKSSFLTSIKAACGTAAPLTDGHASGQVVLQTNDEECTVILERMNGTISRTGNPYLDDEYDRVCAELFAFLDEDNKIRQAVRDGTNVETLLTRPLDFENIDEQIADLRTEREQTTTELERAESAADRLPKLHQRITDLESDLEALRVERADINDETGGENAAREQLSDCRAERERVNTNIERLETTIERVRETLSKKQTELEALSVPSGDSIERELETLHADLRTVERDQELLQSVYEANKRVLDEGRTELLSDISHGMLSDTVPCWLCGEDTTRDSIEAQLDALARQISDLQTQTATTRDRVEELEGKRDAVQKVRRRERELTDRIADLETRLAETEESLTNARERRADLNRQIDELTTEVDTADDRISDLESEIKYTEAALTDVREELEETETQAERRDILEAEVHSLNEEITELRNRKEQIKRRVREAFSASLDDLLARFETGFETARLTSTFELIIARDGREAQLNSLSEGERELLGIVAALAGHKAFDVSDRVPVMLLDQLGGLASDNLQTVVNYLNDSVDYLVLTVYPEYDRFDGHEISPAEWQVVSHDSGVDTAT